MHHPKVLSDPKSGSAANNAAVTNFLTQVNTNVTANVVNLFCADNVAAGPATVGIANHGPNFTGQADITLLFNKLFSSFSALSLKEETTYSPRLYSLDGYTGLQTIGVTTLRDFVNRGSRKLIRHLTTRNLN